MRDNPSSSSVADSGAGRPFFGRSSDALPVAVAGDGCDLIAADGTRVLDASGGAAVSCLGHSDAAVRAAMHAQIDALAYAHTSFFATEPALELARRLTALAPTGIDHLYPVSGGSEAIEAALKLARQYHVDRGQPQRRHVIARTQSYHGNTLGALATGGSPARRAPFAPLLIDVAHIAPCHAYRHATPGETPDAYGRRAAGALEREIERLGGDTVMAFVAETVVGATLGAVPPAPGYLARIREICDRHGVLLILDEVMCGMGRCGTLFACTAEGVAPDIVTVAKGLGAGYAPIGAMLCSGAVHDAVSRDGAFQHGHTYHGHPLAAAAANAVLTRLTDDGLVARCAAMGDVLDAALHHHLGAHPAVGDIRGRGLFRGVELVADRATKAPLDPARRTHARVKAAAFARGVACYPGGGTVDGTAGDHVLLAPPFIVTEAQCDRIAATLAAAIDDALAA